MSPDLHAARAVHLQATEALRLDSAIIPEEVKLAVEVLDIVLDELEARDKIMEGLRASMTYSDPALNHLDPGEAHYAGHRCPKCGSNDRDPNGMGSEIWSWTCKTCGHKDGGS